MFLKDFKDILNLKFKTTKIMSQGAVIEICLCSVNIYKNIEFVLNVDLFWKNVPDPLIWLQPPGPNIKKIKDIIGVFNKKDRFPAPTS